MADEHSTSQGTGNGLGDRLARVLAESAIKSGSVAPLKSVANSASDAEWHVIHAGKELGPLSLGALVEKAATGEIEADDLVKKTGGMWTKARDVGPLHQEFLLKETTERALNQLGQFHGIWLSQKALVIGGGVLLIVLGLAAIWALNNRTNPGQPLIVEKKAADPVLVEKKKPDLVIVEKKNPDFEQKGAEFYHNRGNAMFDKKDYDKAIKDYGEAIRLDPNSAFYYFSRGRAWFIKKDYDKAIEDYGEAIRLNPNDAYCYSQRGDAWSYKGEHDKAIKDYDESIRLYPQGIFVFWSRGNAWYDKREYDKAIKDYDEAIRLDPNFGVFFICRGRAWSNKKAYDKAIKDFSEAIRLNPYRADYYFDRGVAWSNKKNYDNAIRDYDDAIRLDPNDFDARSHRLEAEKLRRQR